MTAARVYLALAVCCLCLAVLVPLAAIGRIFIFVVDELTRLSQAAHDWGMKS